MDAKKPEFFIQNFESLWSFSNVLVSTNPHQTSLFPHCPKVTHNVIANKEKNTNMCPILNPSSTPKAVHQTEQPTSPSPTKATSFLQENSNVVVEEDGKLSPKKRDGEVEAERRSRRKQRSKGVITNSKPGHDQIMVREVKGGNYIYNVDWKGLVMMGEIVYKNDEAAMKKHLKSWAVAVAHTAVNPNGSSLMVAACS